jgi:hypothetical protein
VTALPDAGETLLLRAALGDGPRALADWEAWRARVSLANVAGDSVGVVPLLYRNLRRLGVSAAETAGYASVYRHAWAANRLAFLATADVLRTLAGAGIDTMVLKGAALALAYYRDAGARPMNDIDVMVPAARVTDAMRVLGAAGFITSGTERDLALGHSIPFVDARRRNIDLHWHLSDEARHAGADDDFWRAAVPLVVEGVATRALAPADLLHHIVIHAHASNTAHLRWAADAVMVLRGGAVDWARVVRLARERRAILPVRTALAWLRGALDAPVPAEVLGELAAAPVAWIDHLEYAQQRSARKYTFSKVLLRLWCGHRRSTRAGGVALALGFPGYLGRYYGVSSPWRLPALGVERGLRRIRTHGFL